MGLGTGFVILGTLALAAIPTTPRSIAVAPAPDSTDQGSAQAQIGETGYRLSELLTDPSVLHPEVLAGVSMSADQLGSSGRELATLRNDIEQSQNLKAWAESEQTLRTRTVRTGRRAVAHSNVDVRRAEADLATKERNLTTLSIDAFVSGSDQADLSVLLDADRTNATTRATEALRDSHLSRAAIEDLTEQRDDARRTLNRAKSDLRSLEQQLDREHNLLSEAETALAESTRALATLEPRLRNAQRRFERSLLTRLVPGDEDLTFVAVNAYYRATEIAASNWPQCRIAWHQLAGVGRVESFHGRFGGSELNRHGTTTAKILGPQLNGDKWLAIQDSDGGELDGDLEWDRAVGPMQFIPTSWEIFAADGNGDGIRDPHNLYDASLAAADHLCGDQLDEPGNFRAALLRYNRSASYGRNVERFAERYRELISIALPWSEETPSQG